MYLASNTRTYIYLALHKCTRFTHNTKASHETSAKRVCRYLQGTKDRVMLFNTSNKPVVDCYADTDIVGLWGHENHQYPICARSRAGFMVKISKCPILWVSKIQTDISLSNLYSEYVALYNYVRDLIILNSLINEVIEKLCMDSNKLKLVSRSTVYEDNS